MNFNECLKYERELCGYTQKQLAEFLEITPRSYQRYESGEREPNINTLIKIANLFNISLDKLVGRNFS